MASLYTTSIPAKTNAGTYYVWYKVVGDANHKDTKPACIKVTILYPPSPSITIPVEDGAATTKATVTVTVSGSTVSVNTISVNNLDKAAEANGTVIIDASGLKKDIIRSRLRLLLQQTVNTKLKQLKRPSRSKSKSKTQIKPRNPETHKTSPSSINPVPGGLFSVCVVGYFYFIC